MRLITQAAVLVVLVGASAGGWYGWQNWGPGQGQAAAQQGPGGGPGGGRPGGGGAPIPVEVITVKTGVVTERLESVGNVRANESIVIAAKQTGNIAAINFTEGQKVKAGTVLVDLDAKERRGDLAQAKADAESARAVRDDLKTQYDRAKALKVTGAVADSRLDTLEAQLRGAESKLQSAVAKVQSFDARLDDVRIAAPFDGRVGLRGVSVGALLTPGVQITTLDDISKVKMDFTVPEIAIGRLHAGLPVLARSPTFPDRIFQGEVTVVDTRVDQTTRSVRINATFENSDEALRPGMFMTVELILARRDDAVLIPEEALVPEALKQYVFAVKDGRVDRREVVVGQRNAGAIEIVKGLQAGDTLIVRGLQRVRPGAPVSIQRPTI